MADATDGRIRELEIMIRLIDIVGSQLTRLGRASRLEWSKVLDGPCISSVRGNLFLWMYYSVMQQVLCIDLAVEGVSRKL
jgi:hypothetical protein